MVVDNFSISQVYTLENDFKYIERHHLACHLVDILIVDHKFEFVLLIYLYLNDFVDRKSVV